MYEAHGRDGQDEADRDPAQKSVDRRVAGKG